MVDTQAWRYRDPRTFLVNKFTAMPYTPTSPLAAADRPALSDFVEADLKTQASLGAAAYLLPGVIPNGSHDDVHAETLALLEIAQSKLPDARPCVAFVGAHTSSMEAAHQIIDDLPHWIDGVYVQLTPINPLHDSPSKIIDALMLMRHAARGTRRSKASRSSPDASPGSRPCYEQQASPAPTPASARASPSPTGPRSRTTSRVPVPSDSHGSPWVGSTYLSSVGPCRPVNGFGLCRFLHSVASCCASSHAAPLASRSKRPRSAVENTVSTAELQRPSPFRGLGAQRSTLSSRSSNNG
jgi:hypothetical protein